MSLVDELLQSIVPRLDRPGVIGIALTGSHARGQAGKFSDVDLDIYVEVLPESEYERYTLRPWGERLLSLKYVALKDERASLARPQAAIWAVPGLRQMHILLDRSGQLAELQRAAQAFKWTDLQGPADEYAAEQLMGCAEEVHKLLSGLAGANESSVLNAAGGLVRGLAGAVATQRGVLIESENRYLDVIQDAVGRESDWTRTFRSAIGADVGLSAAPPFMVRGSAALALYRCTAVLFEKIVPEKHRELIESTLSLMKEAGYRE